MRGGRAIEPEEILRSAADALDARKEIREQQRRQRTAGDYRLRRLEEADLLHLLLGSYRHALTHIEEAEYGRRNRYEHKNYRKYLIDLGLSDRVVGRIRQEVDKYGHERGQIGEKVEEFCVAISVLRSFVFGRMLYSSSSQPLR